jgi:hypothetical protein
VPFCNHVSFPIVFFWACHLLPAGIYLGALLLAVDASESPRLCRSIACSTREGLRSPGPFLTPITARNEGGCAAALRECKARHSLNLLLHPIDKGCLHEARTRKDGPRRGLCLPRSQSRVKRHHAAREHFLLKHTFVHMSENDCHSVLKCSFRAIKKFF